MESDQRGQSALHDPRDERDACGFGLIAQLDNRPSPTRGPRRPEGVGGMTPPGGGAAGGPVSYTHLDGYKRKMGLHGLVGDPGRAGAFFVGGRDREALVEATGFRPVSACTALATIADNSPGGVRKASPETLIFSAMVVPVASATASASWRSQADRVSPEWVSLKRMLIRAVALALSLIHI